MAFSATFHLRVEAEFVSTDKQTLIRDIGLLEYLLVMDEARKGMAMQNNNDNTLVYC